ncbi:MAG: hypothetical protein FJ121_04725 [Deltaproteobacteria bacterium]|nr:hypothetical protein [Deltaproteobacteria bacterium]
MERTTHQIDKAWDYFTGLPYGSSSKTTEENFKKEEELKRQIIEEARKETTELMKDAGLQKKTLNELVEKVQSLVGKSTERTRQLLERERISQKFIIIEEELRGIADDFQVFFAKGVHLLAIISDFKKLERFKFINPQALDSIQRLFGIYKGNPSYSDEEIKEISRELDSLIDYLKYLRRGSKNIQHL